MGNDPVSRVHGDERNEADERPLEWSALSRRHQQERENRDNSHHLAESAEREPGILDRLHGAIGLLVEP